MRCRPVPVVGGGEEPAKQPGGLLDRIGGPACEEYAGEGDVLELADVAELVVGGEPLCVCPPCPGVEVSALDLDPGFRSADRADTGGVVGVVASLGLV